MEPDVKLLMRLLKHQLIYFADECGVSIEGNKIDIAKRIAKHQRKEQERIYKSISGG